MSFRSDVRHASNSSHVIRRLWHYFSPFWKRLVALFLLLIVSTVAEVASPYLIGVALDGFIDPGLVDLPGWLLWLAGGDPTRIEGLAITAACLGGVYAISWLMSVVQFRLMVRMSQRVLLDLRADIFDKVQRLSLSFFDTHEAGDLMSRLINDTRVINDVFGPGIMRMLRMAMGMTGILATMFTLSWQLSLASFALVPFVLVLTVVLSRRVRTAYRVTRKTVGDVSAELQENISGVREVQAFARENETFEEFRAVNARNREANVRAETIMAGFGPALSVLSTVAQAMVAGIGGYLVLGFDPPIVSIGLIVSFVTYVDRFYSPIREIAQLWGQFQSAIAGAERIFELLDEPETVKDAPDAVELGSIQGQIAYDGICFSYVPEEPVLQDVSLKIEPGQTVAFVGPTGAGKTTMVNLLMRFYDVCGGAVRVDGHDVRKVTLASLRSQIGIVLQDTFLFSGTVMDNLRYGRLDATDDEVVEAARVANAHAFIERLPEGYQTLIGERGSNLSQGNRQLLSIARAVLNNPRILVLDEATSSVDTRTELLIQDALSRLLDGRTSLVIAHRLSTIRSADLIAVIKGGRIIESGKHQELLAQDGVYHELYMSQFRRETDEPA